MGFQCCKNKSPDQLRGYCVADLPLRICILLYAKSRFSHGVSHFRDFQKFLAGLLMTRLNYVHYHHQVEQLADHTGEESVILTASVSDGSLSHLGSEAGKVFLEDHDDIKSQFLGFCLKRRCSFGQTTLLGS